MSTNDMSSMNIVFAFADDFGRYASCYRGLAGASSLCDVVETPHIDRIASEGVLFSNALVPAPSCTPCRSSLLSGRYFWRCRLGAILLGAVWDRRIPSYPMMLEAAGWHIGFSDKVWSPGTLMDDPYGGVGRRWQQAGRRFGEFSQEVTKEAAGRREGIAAAKERLYGEARGNFRDFLAARPAGAPFCYWWGPTNTHRIWQRGSGQDLWGIDPDRLRGRLPAFLPDVPEIREDVADYLGECQAFDGGVGALIAELEERGELDRTLVVVSGDHGIPGIPRGKCNLYGIGCEVALAARLPARIKAGTRVDGLVNLMDLAPTFLESAGLAPDPGMDGRSLWPLMTGTATAPERDFVVTGRERHVATAREGGLPYPQRAIRVDGMLYIRNYAPERWPMGDPNGMDDPDAAAPDAETLAKDTFAAYADMDASPTKAWMIHHRAEQAVRGPYQLGFGKRPGEELYDLVRDPDQMVNLAGDPAYATRQRQLADRLEVELRAHSDPRASPGPCRFEAAPYTDTVCPDVTASARLAQALAAESVR